MSLAPYADSHVAVRRAARALCVVALLAQGCATLTPGTQGGAPATGAPAPTPTPRPASVEPPAPAINLSGFPLPYRQGYADGCATAGGREQKDAARFASDGNYRTGWVDGKSLCAKK